MTPQKPTRREVIGGSAALGLSLFAAPLKAAAPDPVAITPQLTEAAKKDGKIVLYSAMDLPVGEKLGKAFEAQQRARKLPPHAWGEPGRAADAERRA